jgi:hypothetical protein
MSPGVCRDKHISTTLLEDGTLDTQEKYGYNSCLVLKRVGTQSANRQKEEKKKKNIKFSLVNVFTHFRLGTGAFYLAVCRIGHTPFRVDREDLTYALRFGSLQLYPCELNG